MEETNERREGPRAGVTVNRLVRAVVEWEEGNPEESYLYIVDVSEKGLRVNADRFFAEDRPTRVTFTLENREVSGLARPIWQKYLAGTWTMGLALVDPTEEATEALRALTAMFSPTGRRMRFRLRTVLTTTMLRDGGERWYSILALDISDGGIKARFDEPLEENEVVTIKIFPPELGEVEARAQVKWITAVGPERYEFGLQFVNLSEEKRGVIRSYIDKQVGAA
ncbi:MAG: PilZ domain-containing protein [Armatimonadetes bacterium]|nr:PilZ domain-containing protein [Armatimonadota bacterium]